jgi:hypothetical protein
MAAFLFTPVVVRGLLLLLLLLFGPITVALLRWLCPVAVFAVVSVTLHVLVAEVGALDLAVSLL